MLDIASQCGPARASLSDPWIRRTALQRTYIVRRLPRRERGKQISRRRIDTETPRALTRQLCPNSRAHSHGCSYSRARRHQHARGQHTTRVRDGIREKREHARGPTGRARTGAVARPSPWRPSVSRPPCARTLRGARRAAAVAEQSKVSDRGRTRCRAWKGRDVLPTMPWRRTSSNGTAATGRHGERGHQRARSTRREQPSDEPAQLSYLRAGQRGRDQRPNSVLT